MAPSCRMGAGGVMFQIKRGAWGALVRGSAVGVVFQVIALNGGKGSKVAALIFRIWCLQCSECCHLPVSAYRQPY